MHKKLYSPLLAFIWLSACQTVPVSPGASPSPTPSSNPTVSPSVVPSAVPSASPTQPMATPSPQISATPQTQSLRIITGIPESLRLDEPALILQGNLQAGDEKIEALNWEVLTPELGEIQNGQLILKQIGKITLRAYAPSQPSLEQHFSFEILPALRSLPTPTPSPTPMRFENKSGLLSDIVSAGNYVFTSDKTLDQVHVLDLRTGKFASHLFVMQDPDSLAVSKDGKWVYVASQASDRIYPISVENAQLHSPISAGGKVFDMVAGQDRLYISYVDKTQKIKIIQPSTSAPKGELPEEVPSHSLLCLPPDGKTIYVGIPNTDDARLYSVDISQEDKTEVLLDTLRELTEDEIYQRDYKNVKFDPVYGKNLREMKVSPDGKKLYLALSYPKYPSRIQVLDPVSLKITDHIDLGASPEGLDFSPDGKYLYVSHEHFDIHVFDSQTHAQRLRKPTYLWAERVTASADGKYVFGFMASNSVNSNRTLFKIMDVSEIP